MSAITSCRRARPESWLAPNCNRHVRDTVIVSWLLTNVDLALAFSNRLYIFRRVLDLQKHYKDSAGSSHIPHTQVPWQWYLTRVRNLPCYQRTRVDTVSLTEVHSLFRYPQFVPKIFSAPRSHPGHVTCSCHVCAGFSWL